MPIEWTFCNYGGHRPWFHCPGATNGFHCNRRVAKLFLGGCYYVYRHCYGLVYPSQRVAVTDRPMTRAQKIRMKLGGTGNLLELFLRKPKGMHWSPYWRLWDKSLFADSKRLRIWHRRPVAVDFFDNASSGLLTLFGFLSLTRRISPCLPSWRPGQL